MSNLTIFTVLSVPGFAVTLGVAAWRYDIDLAVSPAIVAAVLLGSLMAVSVGWGVAHAVPDPRLVNLLINLVIFVALLFSPIAFPIENFPEWLAAIHRVLPFWHIASVIRAGLTEGLVTGVAGHYIALVLWTVGSWSMAAWVVGRRR